jgi:hypothetical protein
MAIDITKEELLTFNKARDAFPGGRRPALATLHRWRLDGIRGVRLETAQIGGSRFTSREAIVRFLTEQNASQTPTPSITPSQRRRQAETADRLLQEAGC